MFAPESNLSHKGATEKYVAVTMSSKLCLVVPNGVSQQIRHISWKLLSEKHKKKTDFFPFLKLIQFHDYFEISNIMILN